MGEKGGGGVAQPSSVREIIKSNEIMGRRIEGYILDPDIYMKKIGCFVRNQNKIFKCCKRIVLVC